MADQEFEEFRDGLDDLPQHFTTSVQTYKLVHAITPMEENKSFLEKVQMGEKMWGDLHDEGSESLFTSWSEVAGPGSKMSNIFSDQNQLGGTMTEGDDSGFCKSITSMTSSVSSLVLLKPPPLVPVKDPATGKILASGAWSSSSDSEDDEDIFDAKGIKDTSTSLIANNPIRWDEDSNRKRDKNKHALPRQKLLPSFTKCGSIEAVDNLPPPPILRLSNYNNKKEPHTKSITSSSDKISYSNGATNLSKRRRKQNTAVATHDISTKVAENSRDKNKANIVKVKKEVEKYAILQGRTGGTSQQQHRMSARKVSNSLLNFEAKDRVKKDRKKYPELESPEISLLQELKDATKNSAAIITAAQDLSAMTLSSSTDHPSLPSAFCLLSSCEQHKHNSYPNSCHATINNIEEDYCVDLASVDMSFCLNNLERERHDLDIDEDGEKNTATSCGHSTNGIVDVDSGNSSSHSPSPDDTYQSINTQNCQNKTSNTSPSNGHSTRRNGGKDNSIQRASPLLGETTTDSSSPSTSPTSSSYLRDDELDLLDPTHRGLHRFIPRHKDELEIDIGDPIYVQKEADDLWCEGANMRTGCQGIFPLAHVVDIEYNEFDPSNHGGSLNAGGVRGGAGDGRKERYLLNYLGSIESTLYKGNVVLCQAVRKIVSSKYKPKPHPTVLEISDKGIKIVDKSKINISTTPCHDYFYSLKNVTFCGFHPRQPKYFGFVSKHPTLPKYACHVFVGDRSTQHVAEGCGRAFQRFYQKFIETAFPVEDIYIE